MDTKREGPAFPPLPVADVKGGVGPSGRREAGELPCEMCGASVVAYHCKRICLRCGFMTGCSEGM